MKETNQKETNQKEFYTVQEFAELTNYAATSIRRSIREGKIVAIKVTKAARGKWLIPAVEIPAYIREKMAKN